MPRYIVLAAILNALSCAVACDADFAVPRQGPGTAYPCGVNGVTCTDGKCCGQDESCGGDDPTCPSNSCCYIQDPREGDFARRSRVRPQTEPTK